MKELDPFVQIRKEFVETLSEFPADKVGETVCGKWDLKDVLAHMAAWDHYFTEIVKLLKAGETIPHWGDVEEMNEVFVKERESRTLDEVSDELVRAGEGIIEEYGNLEENLWNKRFWEEGDYTPAWAFEIIVEHYEEHLEEIKKKMLA